ncbi:hypothetical protein LCGC14_0433990, partial [marine sediment metagenome]
VKTVPTRCLLSQLPAQIADAVTNRVVGGIIADDETIDHQVVENPAIVVGKQPVALPPLGQAGDIDRDGDLDLFQGINWLRNNGNNDFETFGTGITYASTPDRAQLADFDRDGDLDAVVGQLSLGGTGNNTEFAWFAAPADPTQPWIRNVLDTDINGSLSVFAVDIDFDGDKDIVVGEWRGEQRLIAFENDLCGSGGFELRVIDDGSLGLEHHDGTRVTDIDNDGDLDVISNGWLNDRIPRIYENTTVPVENEGPIVDAGEDRTVDIGAPFILTGTANDPDGGDIESFLWTLQSGPGGDAATLTGADTPELTVNNTVPGLYVFRLSATDDEGDTGFDEARVSVLPESGILAVAEAAPTEGDAPLEVSFTGSNSVGTITGYLWNFMDGNTSTEADPTNTFLAEGTYEVELTVTGPGGMTDTTSITIVVGETVDGDMMGVFLEQNPPKDGIARIRVMNQPENFKVLGIKIHDIQGRLLNSYGPEDINIEGSATYQVPVHILKAGLYFFEISMNQGESMTLKMIVNN